MYAINEIFYSIQGEGVRAGTANVFVRFAGCNLTCSKEGEAGFDCDTEFMSGRKLSVEDLMVEILKAGRSENVNVILTGGEPALQVDPQLIAALKAGGYYVAIETNGTEELPDRLDWICVSPKTAFHTIRQKTADEFKLVRHEGQALPAAIPCVARPGGELAKLVSPAFEPTGLATRKTLEWCINLVKENPSWRLSVQQHKSWGIR